MRITTPPSIGPLQTTPQTQKAEGPRSAFVLPETRKAEGTPGQARNTSGAAPAAGLDTLLAVQGMQPDDRREKRRRAMQRGRRSLDLLDELKVAMLAGESVPSVLLRLRSLTAHQLEASGEAGLDDVLAEIDLRAQVELAKREAAAAG